MATRQPAQRRDDEPAFVLHAYPYRETSLIVEAFTPNYGRVAMVARGARRPRSETRGLLQAFQPLTLSWAGSGELKTLMKAEWRGGMPLPGGSALLAGFYVNELLMKLLPREDAHAALFDEYAAALAALTERPLPAEQAAVLRRFEVRLLAELGYALALTRDVESGEPIAPHGRYHYVFERGPMRVAANEAHEPGARGPLVRGATLLALTTQEFPDADVAAEAKRLMREVLDHHLEERRIFSRRVVRDLMALDEEGSAS
jgi:DNA repair protein RecO (recombination protein O)